MEGLFRRESPGVGGDAPQGLGVPQSYSDVTEVKHNKNCTSKPTSSLRARHNILFLPLLIIFVYI